MASKNLGAVIQRAISDGAFRRQLQSDPAAALRGFNLSPDEIAAIRSGDSGKLMSLGVDQRMSKAFTVGGGFLGATRSTASDLSSGGANTLVGDATVGTREGIVGDPTASTGTSAVEDPNAPEFGATHATPGDLSGIRSVNDVAPFGSTGTSAIEDPNAPEFRAAQSIAGDLSAVRSVNDVAPFGSTGTSAVEDPNAPEFGAAASTGDLSGVRAVNDVAPFGSTGTSAIEDPNAPEFGAAHSTGDASGVRAVNDVAPFEGNVSAVNDNLAAAGAGRGGSLTGDMSDTRAVNDSEPFAGNAAVDDNIAAAGAGRGGSLAGDMSGTGSAAAEDPYSGSYQGVSPDFQADGGTLASRMADAGTADAVRAINDVAPFEGDASAAAPSGSEFLGGDARLDPGTDSAHGFIPSDSADVQRELLDGIHGGDALGNAGGGGNTSS